MRRPYDSCQPIKKHSYDPANPFQLCFSQLRVSVEKQNCQRTIGTAVKESHQRDRKEFSPEMSKTTS